MSKDKQDRRSRGAMGRWVIMLSLLAGAASHPVVSRAGEMVATPFGEFPKECVHQHPHETVLEEVEQGVKATHPDGTVETIPYNPACAPYVQRARGRRLSAEAMATTTNSLPIKWQWFNYVGWTAPSEIATYTATYTVPDTPTNVSNQVLFYFIGIQNDATIVQPVLGFENQAWHISSWNCCIGGVVNNSPFIYGMKPGDEIGGSITADAAGAYTITTTWNGTPTTFKTTPVTSPFTWGNAALEVYTINSCDEFSSGPMTFANMKLLDSSGVPLTPDWGVNPPGGQTICNGRLALNGDTITIQENIYLDIEAGPIWSNNDAQTKCPKACAGAGLNWSGAWQTTVPGQMSVCGCI